MGQKIHPIGFRLSVNRNWQSRWFASPREFPKMLQQDIEIRDYVRRSLGHASIGKVIIERPSKSARITIFSSKPGVVIGKKGEGIEKFRQDIQKKLGVAVAVNIEELRKPELDAQVVCDAIAQQLEKRVMFRRAMKRAIQQAIRLGAQGIKIACSGRLNGIEIARSEWYREGRVPMHTLRSNIDYALSEAKTTYGIIGVKIWIYRGDSLVHEVVVDTKTHTSTDEVVKDVNVPKTIRITKKKGYEDEVSKSEENKQDKKSKSTKAKKTEVAKAKESKESDDKKEVKKTTVKKRAVKEDKSEKNDKKESKITEKKKTSRAKKIDADVGEKKATKTKVKKAKAKSDETKG